MNIKPIRDDEDLKAVFRRLEALFQAEEQTPEADERDVLVTLVEAYAYESLLAEVHWRPGDADGNAATAVDEAYPGCRDSRPSSATAWVAIATSATVQDPARCTTPVMTSTMR